MLCRWKLQGVLEGFTSQQEDCNGLPALQSEARLGKVFGVRMKAVKMGDDLGIARLPGICDFSRQTQRQDLMVFGIVCNVLLNNGTAELSCRCAMPVAAFLLTCRLLIPGRHLEAPCHGCAYLGGLWQHLPGQGIFKVLLPKQICERTVQFWQSKAGDLHDRILAMA